jgi:hypothetical protein
MNTFRANKIESKLNFPSSFVKMTRILAVILYLSAIIGAQEATKSTAHYLDGIANAKQNNIQVNIAAIVNGDVSILYEKWFGDFSSLSVGYGILLPYYAYNLELESLDLEQNGINPYTVEQRRIGRSFLVQTKMRLFDGNRQEIYSGLAFRNRRFSTDSIQAITFHDYCVSAGIIHDFSNDMFFDSNLAVGLRNIKLNSDKLESNQTLIQNFITFNLSIGFKF